MALDFLGIGAQKSGSTWLYGQLVRHPGIRFPAGKEVHFWDQQRERGLDWYRGLFDGDHGDAKVGDMTPAYATLDASVVADIHREFPDLRLLFMVRNPIARAWSAASMYVEWAGMRLDEVSDQWFLDMMNSQASLLRGDFERTIRVWREEFGEDALLVREFDLVRKDPQGLLRDVAAHIDVDVEPLMQIEGEVLGSPIHQGFGAPIRPSLLPRLHELYDSRIRALGDYLQRDYSHWLADDAGSAQLAGEPSLAAAKMRQVAGEHGAWTAHNVRVARDTYTLAPVALNVEEKTRRVVQTIGDLVDDDLSKLSILDLGSHEGGFSLELGAHGARVVGVEVRADNFARAEFARQQLGLDNVSFHRADVRTLDPESWGQYDVVICLGLLYHLDCEDVARLIDRMHAVAGRMVIIDTHFALEPTEWFEFEGKRYHGTSFREHEDDVSLQDMEQAGWASIGNIHSFWFTKQSLINRMMDAGFSSVLMSEAPFSYDTFDRESLERYRYADRGWFVGMKGRPRSHLTEPLANAIVPRRQPEKFAPVYRTSPIGEQLPIEGEPKRVRR